MIKLIKWTLWNFIQQCPHILAIINFCLCFVRQIVFGKENDLMEHSAVVDSLNRNSTLNLMGYVFT